MDINPDDILEFLEDSPKPLTKGQLARSFKIKGDDRRPFKDMLRMLVKKGKLVKYAGGTYAISDALPNVGVIEITEISADGDVFARATNVDEDASPKIEVLPSKKLGAAPALRDRMLARLEKQDTGTYVARIIRSLDKPQNRMIGLIRETKKGFLLLPSDKKVRNDFVVHRDDLKNAKDGDLVRAEIQPARHRVKQKSARVLDILGHESDRSVISILSAIEQGLPESFLPETLSATKNLDVPPVEGREDLRDTPLVTIDGIDAKDFDDAVFAEKLDDGGFHLIVAIADVSYYVLPDEALDKEAYYRGNSTYFPDRVIPMLPERLSNDLCSLRPDEDRACLAAHLWIDEHGELQKYKFTRGLMRSKARLVYEQVQAAKDGVTDDLTAPLLDDIITPLYAAYDLLAKAREKRGALDLDLPERQIIIDDKGQMTDVKLRERVDSHKLIEEMMILANVAAARALEDKNAPCVYRVHEKPDATKLDDVRSFVEAFGLSLPKGQVLRSESINQVLRKAEGLPFAHLISEVILRTQSQAHYSTKNYGHFGLALAKYAHFTSPIRRYSDLLVHRSLITAYQLGPNHKKDGLIEAQKVQLEEKADHISQTERRSVVAERSATDRFTASYLEDHIGAEFRGRISSVTKFGLFVQLEETGADGLIPMRNMPDDYYELVEEQHALIGRHSGRIFRLGATLTIRIVEADGLSGSTIFEIVGKDGADIPGIQFKKHRAGSSTHQKKDRHRDRKKPSHKHKGKRKKPHKKR